MTDMLLERGLADTFAAGPVTAPRGSVDRALERALTLGQRSRRFAYLDDASWPPPRGSIADPGVRRTLRLALVIALVMALATTTILVGTRLLDRSLTPPIPAVPTALPPSAPPQTARPLVEDLGAITARQLSSFSAIRLLDGRVLLAGGADTTDGQVTINDAWLFDPTTNRIVETGPMADPRSSPLLALLPDGRVLVLGGVLVDEATEPVVSAELFDPATGTFRPSAGLPLSRLLCPCGAFSRAWAIPHMASLPDGRVLVSGGQVATGEGHLAELYDPAADQFERIDVGCDATRGVQAVLGGGLVLVTCLPDRADAFPPQAALFDPTANTFSVAGRPTTLANDTATRLPDGRVLVTGSGESADAGADVFDPETGAFASIQLAEMMDGAFPGFDIGEGRLLFIGVNDLELGQVSARILDVPTLTLRDVDIPALEFPDIAIQLADGRILLAGYRLHLRLLDPGNLP